ncbi:MAG: hypothetical protein ACKOUK_11590 [Verrucomicrobiota bacterium]
MPAGEEAGGRRPCLTVGPGELAFGFAPGPHGLAVLASGLEGTRLHPVPVAALWAAAEEDAPLAWIAARLERWTTGLTQALAEALPGVPPADVLLGTKGDQEVSAGRRAAGETPRRASAGRRPGCSPAGCRASAGPPAEPRRAAGGPR